MWEFLAKRSKLYLYILYIPVFFECNQSVPCVIVVRFFLFGVLQLKVLGMSLHGPPMAHLEGTRVTTLCCVWIFHQLLQVTSESKSHISFVNRFGWMGTVTEALLLRCAPRRVRRPRPRPHQHLHTRALKTHTRYTTTMT